MNILKLFIKKNIILLFMIPDLVVVSDVLGLNFYPKDDSEFYEPPNATAVNQLVQWIINQPDGSCFPIRGRDFISFTDFDEWDSGVAVKDGERLFFIYESGCIESFYIHIINFKELIHFTILKEKKNEFVQDNINCDPLKVIILSHGFSDQVGPNYPLIRSLETIAIRLGWKVIVPDFRPTYKFGAHRGRAERVRMIYEELLCLNPKPEIIVLIGHSQGGAASCLACTERVVNNYPISGLLLFGSENPLSLDAMDWIPPFPKEKMLFVHSEGDYVISIGEIENVTKRWNCDLIQLNSTVKHGERDCWGDDIHHDFIAKDLMNSAVDILKNFLSQFE